MSNAKTWQQRGAELYEQGRIINPVGPARGWQMKHLRNGYVAAREAWRKANPNADEWGAASKRNFEFCLKALKQPTSEKAP